MRFDLEGLKVQGFEGFFSFRAVKESHGLVPNKKGLYIIYSENSGKEFLAVGTGGYFHGCNPMFQ